MSSSFWMNGGELNVDWQRFYSFVHDLPEPINEKYVTGWLDLLYEADDCGSGWSHQLIYTLVEVKYQVLCNYGLVLLDQRTTQSITEIGAQKLIDSLMKDIDVMIARLSEFPISVWTSTEDWSYAEILFGKVNGKVSEVYLELCHVKRERFRLLNEVRRMQKTCNSLINKTRIK